MYTSANEKYPSRIESLGYVLSADGAHAIYNDKATRG